MSSPTLTPPTTSEDYSKELRLHPAGLAFHLSKGEWKPYKHLLLICQVILDAIFNNGPRFIIITLPPRHGKSELISYWLPIWILENFKKWRIILASYEADFAASWGRKVRDTIEANEHELTIRISKTASAANRWDTATLDGGRLRATGGGMITAGRGGPIVGRGGNFIIVDDIIKNSEEAESPTERDNIWKWFNTSLLSRMEPKAICVMLITRWHQDDPVGRIEELQADPNYKGRKWRIINLPALATENDELGREPGEALCPERYDEKALLEIMHSDSETWEALYQQNPKPPGGTTFNKDWWLRNRYDASQIRNNYINDRKVLARFQSWDTALKDTERSAYSVCETFDLLDDYRLALRDVMREKITFDALPDRIQEEAVKWNHDGLLQNGIILIENKSSGISAIQTLSKTAPEWIQQLLVPWEPGADKETRAKLQSVWCRRGCVLLPLQISVGTWLYLFEKELFDFPGSTFKDQVDTFTQMLSYLENYLAAGYEMRMTNPEAAPMEEAYLSTG